MERDRPGPGGAGHVATIAGTAMRAPLGTPASAERGFDQGSIPGVAAWGDVAAPTSFRSAPGPAAGPAAGRAALRGRSTGAGGGA